MPQHNLCKLLLLLYLSGSLVYAQYGFEEYPYGEDEEENYYDDAYFSDFGFDEGLSSDMFSVQEPDCMVLPSGRVQVNGTKACDFRITGSDSSLPGLHGGLDGLYILNNCYDNRPSYTRKDSPPGEGRMVFFDSFYQDWGIKRDDGIPPSSDENLLAFGGFGVGEERPQIVETIFWLMNQTFTSDKSDDPEFPWVHVDMTVTCENEQGEKVDFAGEVQAPQFTPHPNPHEVSSKSNPANDEFYSHHTSGSEASGGHRVGSHGDQAEHKHKGSAVLKIFYAALVAGCVGGAAFFGWSALQIKSGRGGFAGTLGGRGSSSAYPSDIDMTATPIASEHGYTAPSVEETPLVNARNV
mmetsp:Transcript_20774/g.57669  ORF Transcript_20774/g.57669 Transcript_20774/m.57669 type:complete len:353 (-) Transcript_20774:245-1303(-)